MTAVDGQVTTPERARRPVRDVPRDQAFLLLRVTFTLIPVVFGLDKFTHWLTDWTHFLAPMVNDLVPGTAQQAIYAVGVVEICAGLLVAWRPRLGAYIVAAWLVGIIVDLAMLGGQLDIAIRDAGLVAGVVALARLAEPRPEPRGLVHD
jgi:hypothetical protein